MQAEATEAQVNAYHDLIVKTGNDEEFKAAYFGVMSTHWTESDANNDGKLDKTEFFAFLAKRKPIEMSEQGIYWPAWVETSEDIWECVNAISEGEGAVVMDWFRFFGPWLVKYKQVFNK